MNETRKTVRYRKPPRFLLVLFNPISKTILRSPLHRMMSRRLGLDHTYRAQERQSLYGTSDV